MNNTINWKEVSKSKGYMSLKQACITGITEKVRHRPKSTYTKLFKWVICRAKHYAHKHRINIIQVLDVWEKARGTQWVVRYYSEYKFPRIFTPCVTLKPRGLKGWKKYDRLRGSTQSRKRNTLRRIKLRNKSSKIGAKGRWPKWRKEQKVRLSKYI